jgi:hypothetical protein
MPAFGVCGENDFDPSVGPPAKGNFDSRPFLVGYVANDPTAQYIRAGSGALATVGRNTLLTKPINNIDLTAVKRINLTERYKVEFYVNAFNVLNHAQFVPGSLNDIASIGFTSTGVSNYLTPGNAVFNQANQTFSSNPRVLQLGLKINF